MKKIIDLCIIIVSLICAVAGVQYVQILDPGCPLAGLVICGIGFYVLCALVMYSAMYMMRHSKR